MVRESAQGREFPRFCGLDGDEPHGTGESFASLVLKISGRRDLNSRPLEPHSSALPSCATARNLRGKLFNWMPENEKENFSDPPYFPS